MLQYRFINLNIFTDEPIDEWWDNGANQIAFARKHKGFLVINLDKTDINEIFNVSTV